MADQTPNQINSELHRYVGDIPRLLQHAAGSTADDIILTDLLLPATEVEGYTVRFKTTGANTDDMTVSLTDGLGSPTTWAPAPLRDIESAEIPAGGVDNAHIYTITRVGSQWEITSFKKVAATGGADATSVVNLGDLLLPTPVGEGVFFQEVGDQIQLKSLHFGPNMMLSSDDDLITFTSKGGVHALNFVEDLGGKVGTSAQDASDNATTIRDHENSGDADKPVYFGPGAYAFDAEMLLGKSVAPDNVPVSFKKTYFGAPGATVRFRNDYMKPNDDNPNGTKLLDITGIDRQMSTIPSWLYQTPSDDDQREINMVRGSRAGLSIDPTKHTQIYLEGDGAGENLSGDNVTKITAIGPDALMDGVDLHHITAIGVKAGKWMATGHRVTFLDSNAGEFAAMNDQTKIQAVHPYHRQDYVPPPGEPIEKDIGIATVDIKFANWVNKEREIKFPDVRDEIANSSSYSSGNKLPWEITNFGTIKSSTFPADEKDATAGVFIGRDALNKGQKFIDSNSVGYKTFTVIYELECSNAIGKSAMDRPLWVYNSNAIGEAAAAKPIEVRDSEIYGTRAMNEAATINKVLAAGYRAGQHIGLRGPSTDGGAPASPIPGNHITISGRLQGPDYTSTIADSFILMGPNAGRNTDETKSIQTLKNSFIMGVDAASDYGQPDVTDTLFLGNHASIPFLGGDLVKNQIGVGITKPELEAFQSQPTEPALPGMYVLQSPGAAPNAIDISDGRSAFVAINDGDTGYTAVAGGTNSVSTGSYVITRGGIASTTVLKHDFNTDITTLRASDPDNPKIQIWADTGVEIWDSNPSTGNLVFSILPTGEITMPNLPVYDDKEDAQANSAPQWSLYMGSGATAALKVASLVPS